MGYRVSTRSTYSINDSEHRNDEQIEKLVQSNIKEVKQLFARRSSETPVVSSLSQMFRHAPNGVFPMVFRLPADDDDDRYRIEGGYDEPSQWHTQTKIHPNDCQISTQNIASIYSKTFYDEVKASDSFARQSLRFVFSLIRICTESTNHRTRWSCRSAGNTIICR